MYMEFIIFVILVQEILNAFILIRSKLIYSSWIHLFLLLLTFENSFGQKQASSRNIYFLILKCKRHPPLEVIKALTKFHNLILESTVYLHEYHK